MDDCLVLLPYPMTSRERDKQRERQAEREKEATAPLTPPLPSDVPECMHGPLYMLQSFKSFALRPVRASRITASRILGAQPPRSTTMRGTAPPNPRPPLLLILLPSPPAPLSLSLVNQLLLLLLNPPCFRAPVVWLSSGVGSRLSPCAFSLILYMLRSSSF